MSDEFGMTGEMSLTGKVFKIGGFLLYNISICLLINNFIMYLKNRVKEKVLAAKREGIKKLIFPS
jgi:ATP-dependent Lon protease